MPQRLNDFYGDPPLLRRWYLIDGQAQCPHDAVQAHALTEEQRGAILAANESIRQTIAEVEEYEAALRLSARDEPPETVEVTDDEGESQTVPNPDHEAWVAAKELVENADPETVKLANVRAGEPVAYTEPEDGDPEPIYAEPDPVPEDDFAELEPVPYRVTAVSAEKVLRAADLWQNVDGMIDQLPEDQQVDFRRATYWRIQHPVVLQMAVALDLPFEQVRELFRQAGALDEGVVN